ncbi:MAG TPA: hypothetical protein VMS21_07685 [Methylomirabilota bacterium]|nr:hypothetical protein [Methylomirabilota bacterium]
MTAFRYSILLLISVFGLASVKAAETIYFLVAEIPGRVSKHDSYVLPLSEQEDIDHARFLISQAQSGSLQGGDQTIVAAKLAAGKDGINRNMLDPKLPEWSWHIVEFLRFADISAELLDGNPTQVENNPDWYQGNDGRQGLIGFWNYTVVRELGSSPLYLSIVPDGEQLEFYWSGLGTNQVYTLEYTESPAGTNWLVVPGGEWPLKTNHWVLPKSDSIARFYRVKAAESGN